jgi:hypothetical protein
MSWQRDEIILSRRARIAEGTSPSEDDLSSRQFVCARLLVALIGAVRAEARLKPHPPAELPCDDRNRLNV